MKHTGFKRLAVLVAVTALAALSAVSVALADNVVNDVAVDTTTSTKILTVTAGDTTGATVNYQVISTGSGPNPPDGQSGCNASDGSPVTVTPTGMPAGVTATPTSRQFSSCGPAGAQGIAFTASTNTVPGDYTIERARQTPVPGPTTRILRVSRSGWWRLPRLRTRPRPTSPAQRNRG